MHSARHMLRFMYEFTSQEGLDLDREGLKWIQAHS